MMPLSLRAGLILAALIPAVYFLVQGDVFGWGFLGVAVFLAYGYLRYGTVWLAFRAAARGRLDQSERYLKQTWFPTWLERRYRSHYYWLKGLFAARIQSWPVARQLFTQALEIGPRTTTDRALLLGILAYACAADGDFSAAWEYLAAARALPQNPDTTRILDQYEQEIAAHSGGEVKRTAGE